MAGGLLRSAYLSCFRALTQQCVGPCPRSISVCSAHVQLNQPAIHPSGQYVIQAAQGGWIKVSLFILEFACRYCAVWNSSIIYMPLQYP